MLSVSEALELVLQQVRPLAPREVPLGEAPGCRLMEEVASDVDSPPHDKSVVDGYAIRFADLTAGRAELRLLEEVTAGRVPQHSVEPGTTTRIMTGAPLPVGADTVVMVERTSQPAAERVVVDDAKAKLAQHIVRRGASMRRGEIVVRPDDHFWINAAQIGLLAEVGRAAVRVIPRPQVAILATGDELVPPHQTPGPGQIRNSNGPMLAAMVTRTRAVPLDLGIARDDRDDLRAKIIEGLKADALILSGGVSMGVLDLIPGVLHELGVREVLHKVHMKPGKPFWFGTFTASDGVTKPVFGLPGNPVSSFVCYDLFVRPALGTLQGCLRDDSVRTIRAKMGEAFQHRGDRPTYWPARLQRDDALRGGEDGALPLMWQGSGDLRGLAAADCLVYFPAGDHAYSVGDQVQVRLIV